MAITLAGVGTVTQANALNGLTGQVYTPHASTLTNDLMLCISHRNDDQGTFDSTSGWTIIDSFVQGGQGQDRNLHLMWKKATSDSEGTVTLTHSNNATEQWAGVIMSFRGVDTTTPWDVAFVSGSHRSDFQNVETTNVDAFDSITTVTNKAWIIAVEFLTHNDVTSSAVPSGYTNLVDFTQFTDAGNTNHRNIMAHYKELASFGADTPGAPAYTSNAVVADKTVYTLALRPAAATVCQIDSVPTTLWFDETDVDIDGQIFEATQNGGKVYLSDVDSLGGGANEVDISSAINTWGNTQINLDFSSLSAGEVTSLHTLGPGQRYYIVVNDSAEEDGSIAFAMHRPTAVEIIASNVTPGTQSLVITGSGSGTAGRLEEAAAQNPSTTTIDVADDGYRNDGLSVQFNANAVADDTYEFVLHIGSTQYGTYTKTAKAKFVSGAAEFTLVADAGAFLITGAAATGQENEVIIADAGAFLITGAAAVGVNGYALTADAGAFLITGAAATGQENEVIIADAGAFLISGAAAVGVETHVLIADAGAFVITGAEATGVNGYAITADAGAFLITGAAAVGEQTHILIADAGAFLITGADAVGAQGFMLTADAGAFLITGAAAVGQENEVIIADAGAFLITGAAAVGEQTHILIADAGAFLITGADAVGAQGYVLTADAGAFLITGAVAVGEQDHVLVADAGAFLITGADAVGELVSAGELLADSGVFLITGADATGIPSYVLVAAAGAFLITGADAVGEETEVEVDLPDFNILPSFSGGAAGRTAYDNYLKKRRKRVRRKIKWVKEDEEVAEILSETIVRVPAMLGRADTPKHPEATVILTQMAALDKEIAALKPMVAEAILVRTTKTETVVEIHEPTDDEDMEAIMKLL